MARRKKRKGGGRKGRRKHKRSHKRRARRTKRRGGKRKGRRGRRKARKGGGRKRKGGRRKARRGKKRRRKGTRRHRRSSRRRSTRRRSRRRKSRRRRSRRTSVRRRRRVIAGAMRAYSPYGPTGTIRMNPRRRRRRRKGGGRRRGRRGRLARRYSKRYRRNPGIPGGGAVQMVIGLAKRALPVLAGWMGARIVISKIAPRIPLIDRLGTLQAPVMAAALPVAYHYLSKKVSILNKYKSEVMLGMGINFVQTLISTFAPASVKAALGMGGMYDAMQMGEYVGLSDYLMTGQAPIDDDIALSDYITVGAEEELGSDGLQQELGLEQELGDIGGVSQSSMMAPVPTRGFLGPIPTRSFTRQVPGAGVGFDNAGTLYTGIFGGGL